MVTIHGQADQIRLTGEAAQRRALDQFGGAQHRALLKEYRSAFREAVEVKRRLDSLRFDASERAEELEDLRSAIAQIDELDPHVGEEEELTREAARLTNVEDLRAAPTRDSTKRCGLTKAWLRWWLARAARSSNSKRSLTTRPPTCPTLMWTRPGSRKSTRDVPR